MSQPLYLTTSILYPNGDPHLGHALELVQTDFLARYYRQFTDRPVRFQTGLDEHGLKVKRTAEKAGKTAEAFVAEKAPIFQKLADTLHISYDRFIRTSETDHIQMAQALWNRCLANGDIYKKTYRAWYNIKQEEFLGMADEVADPSVFGVDAQFLELIEEENYFFAQSKYTQPVLELIKSGAYKIWPENRALEMSNFAEQKGLQDISISRDIAKLAWGVPVPHDETQVMYVWYDALTNYLTGAGTVENGEIVPDQFWPAELHCVGKDIARFHALLWPAMLLSAGLATPRGLLIHGMMLTDGKAMSKSLGNVVDPFAITEEFGVDALRWYFLAEIPTTGDGDFTMERLGEVYASDLANDYGNLVSRVHTMCRKYCEGRVPQVSAEQVDNLEKAIVEEKWQEYHAAVGEKKLHESLKAAHALIVFSNRRIEEQKPWVMAKEGKQEELNELLYELLEIIRTVTVMVTPAIPSTAERVMKDVFPPDSTSPQWGALQPGAPLGAEQVILFPRRDAA